MRICQYLKKNSNMCIHFKKEPKPDTITEKPVSCGVKKIRINGSR